MRRPEIETAATRMADLVAGVDDDDLDRPTPCSDSTVGALLDHIDGFVQAFTVAGTRSPGSGDPPGAGDARHLRADWRTAIPDALDSLVAAWRPDAAHAGTVRAGGVTMPAAAAAAVLVEELVVHGWDLACATGQPFVCTDDEITLVDAFLDRFGPDERGDAYAPARTACAGATPIDRIIALSGRDPSWTVGR